MENMSQNINTLKINQTLRLCMKILKAIILCIRTTSLTAKSNEHSMARYFIILSVKTPQSSDVVPYYGTLVYWASVNDLSITSHTNNG